MSKKRSKKQLYLATSISQLNTKAQLQDKISRTSNPKTWLTSADKVFKKAEEHDLLGDEETAYVFYMRFFNIVQEAKKTTKYQTDKKFYASFINPKSQLKAIERAEKLSKSLSERYEILEIELKNEQERKLKREMLEKAKNEEESKAINGTSISLQEIDELLNGKQPQKQASSDVYQKLQIKHSEILSPNEQHKTNGNVSSSKIKSQACVTPIELYELLNNKEQHNEIIIFDIRSKKEFDRSHINYKCCINVPDELLKTSVHVGSIERKLPRTTWDQWITRGQKEHVVILDACTQYEELLSTDNKLQYLKDAIYLYDSTTTLNNEPLLLDGGFEAWLWHYPSLVTNPMLPKVTQSPTIQTINLDELSYPELPQKIHEVSTVDPIRTPEVPATKKGEVNQFKQVASQDKPVINRAKKPDENMASNITKQPSLPNNIQPGLPFNSSLGPNQPPVIPNQPPVIPNQPPLIGQPPVIPNLPPIIPNLPSFIPNQPPVIPNQPPLIGQPPVIPNQPPLNGQPPVIPNQPPLNGQPPVIPNQPPLNGQPPVIPNQPMFNGQPHVMSYQPSLSTNNTSSDAKQTPGIHNQPTISANQPLPTSKPPIIPYQSPTIPSQPNNTDNKTMVTKNQTIPASEKPVINQTAKIIPQPPRTIPHTPQVPHPIPQPTIQSLPPSTQTPTITNHTQIPVPPTTTIPQHIPTTSPTIPQPPRHTPTSPPTTPHQPPLSPTTPHAGIPQLFTASSPTGMTHGLPPGWERILDRNTGRYYFRDHNTRTTHWYVPQHLAKSLNQAIIDRGGPPRNTSTINTTPNTKKPTGGGKKASLKRSLSSPNLANLDINHEPTTTTTNTSMVPRQPSINRKTKPLSESQLANLSPSLGGQGKGLTGLRNLGNSCYMNSILQCLLATAPIVKYILNNFYIDDINKNNPLGTGGRIVEELAVLIKASYSGNYRCISPLDFKRTVGRFAGHFGSHEQQDSQEFLLFLLDQFHEDTNKVVKKAYIEEKSNEGLPDKVAAKLAWSNHKTRNQSIIVELLQGQFKSSLTCDVCHKQSITFEAFMSLTLPLPTSGNCQMEDCIKMFTTREKVNKDNKWFCPRCKTHREAWKELEIWKLPPILIVHFNRFKRDLDGSWLKKLNTNVDFPTKKLNMSKFVLGPKKPSCYNLYGVSNHFGSMQSGHYTAYCKNIYNKQWFKFDDDIVSNISETNIKSSAAYILCYTTMDFMKP